MPLIETKNITKVYGLDENATTVLRGIDFSVEKGEFIAIVGQSGSGKSTLLQMLALLDSPTEGKYLLNDIDTSTLTDEQMAVLRNSTMSIVFQLFNLLPRTSVLENVKLPLAYSKIPTKLWNAKAMKQIEAVGLTHRIYHEPSQLSGGERQRVAIARALVTDPEIIFADEPTGNLDTKSGKQIMEIIDGLHKKGKTIILITHDRNIAKTAERAIVIRDGKIIWDGNAQNIPEIS